VKHVFSILLITLFYSGFAQTSNKKRVLVIPPSRFEFVSEYDLETIAQKNEIAANQVFLTYEKTLLSTFEKYYDENFEFVAVKADLLRPYKKKIRYKDGKFKGKRYNAIDLKNFPEADFSKLLESHNTDFVIFITWYDIQKEAFSRKHSKRFTYAGHYLDYDIYNLFSQQIVGMPKVKAEANNPNDLEVTLSLSRAK